MPAVERGRLLTRLFHLVEKNGDELAALESRDTGKPARQGKADVTATMRYYEFYGGAADKIHGDTLPFLEGYTALTLREPHGVVAGIIPWNYPLQILARVAGAALAMGNTLVVKPAEDASLTAIRMAELAREAGFPDGVFNVVTGYGDPAGQVLAEDPGVDMVAFTGSVRVGTKLGEIAARSVKRVGLELGGKGPQIVFADADLDAAADGIAYGVYHNAGQCCISGSRLLVEEGIRDALMERLVDISRKVTFGDPLNERTKIGAMISEAHAEKVHSYVEAGVAAGAELLLGGERVGRDAGLYYAPTVFAGVTPDMSIAREEIFGPVLSTLTFKTADEAVAMANATEFGLSASVWSTNLETALQSIRRIRAGRCWINSVIDGTPELPIGGYKKSGLGRELGRYGFDEYSQFKGVHVTLGRPAPWFA
jgi:acyl-CoA reductase-like NAD-dependent aldehyde dehydrogenase